MNKIKFNLTTNGFKFEPGDIFHFHIDIFVSFDTGTFIIPKQGFDELKFELNNYCHHKLIEYFESYRRKVGEIDGKNKKNV